MARGRSGKSFAGAALITFVTLLSACDSDSLMPPQPAGGSMFARYAAIGNSITAGFQSGGINDSTQMQSYAVLLAKQFGLTVGEDFNVPLLNMPGCPPPIIDIFTQTRVAGGSSTDCALRQIPTPTSLNNAAVPGAAVIDALTNLDLSSDPNALTTLFLGGRTQLELVREVRPTFVTIWLGNNDVLGSLLNSGDPGAANLITSPTDFATRYSAMMDSLDAIGTIQGGVALGVVQVVAAPFASLGGAYFLAAQVIPTLTVLPNCLDAAPIPGSTDSAHVLVPFPFGGLLMAQAAAGVPTTLDCSVPQVVTVPEALNMITTVAQYNTTIQVEAEKRDWIFLDPNILLRQLQADPSAIRPFPAFDPADPGHIVAPFGSALSRDGFHPSAATHVMVANTIIDAINAKYGLNLLPVQ
ncbi:MAG: SGNH/GDSL hydrolase family protein [Gemmatimonadales bacterium]